MRPFLLLLAVIVLTLICGALLAWPVHLLLEPFTQVPFHKIISRTTSLLSLVFIFIYLHVQHLLSRETVGFSGERASNLKNLFIGLAAGLVIMLILEIVFLALGIHQGDAESNFNLQNLTIILVKAIFAGIMVGVVEETLYRGALLGGLNRQLNIYAAVLVSSSLYAAVHFIKFRAVPEDIAISFLTGLRMLPDAFFRFADPATLDAFLSLFIFGILLALIRLKNGNIYQCIGVHAGVVMMIKMTNNLTDYVPGTGFDFLVNRYDHLLGYLASSWLLLLTLIYLVYFSNTSASKSAKT